MKYIRTKDEIRKAIQIDETIFRTPKGNVYADEVISQADTLEELYDEFVIEYENGHHIVYDELEWAKDKALRSGNKYIIYGAIWTDKGLKYIAKMNSKGELELL